MISEVPPPATDAPVETPPTPPSEAGFSLHVTADTALALYTYYWPNPKVSQFWAGFGLGTSARAGYRFGSVFTLGGRFSFFTTFNVTPILDGARIRNPTLSMVAGPGLFIAPSAALSLGKVFFEASVGWGVFGADLKYGGTGPAIDLAVNVRLVKFGESAVVLGGKLFMLFPIGQYEVGALFAPTVTLGYAIR
jgi:hypothetical protein